MHPFWKENEVAIKELAEYHRACASIAASDGDERKAERHRDFYRLVDAMDRELVSLAARHNGLSKFHDEYIQKRADYDAERRGGAR